jgi:hypothetical protein
MCADGFLVSVKNGRANVTQRHFTRMTIPKREVMKAGTLMVYPSTPSSRANRENIFPQTNEV